MRVFFVATVLTLVLCGAVGSSSVMRAAQDVLPDAPGKDITVLKKIAGLDYKKIEARKELLACM
jgi:hypothetical protein